MLASFKGVRPKCANLALGIGCKQTRISVDIHVHRATNQWGVIRTRTPEQTMVALEEILPREHWIEINRLLVPFGKHVHGHAAEVLDVSGAGVVRAGRCDVPSMIVRGPAT